MAASLAGLRTLLNRLHGFQGNVEFFAYSGERGRRFHEISLVDQSARFLQGGPRRVQGRPGIAQFVHGNPGLLGRAKQPLEARGTRRGAGVGRVGRESGVRHEPGRLDGALPRVDGVAQGLAVVALIDGLVRFLQGGHGARELVGGDGLGAGRTRGVNRGLGLIDFLPGRLGTTRGGEQQDAEQQTAHVDEKYSSRDMKPMKTVAPYDRPREKLQRVGQAALGDNELLAIVLGHGVPNSGALDLANAVLHATGGLHGLARASADELRRVPGIGAVRAAQLIAAVETGRRTLLRGRRERLQILTAVDAARVLVPEFGLKPVEHFGVLLLDTRHQVLRTSLVSIGSLNTSIVHPREVFREATIAGAAAIILFHNHPSGDPRPSDDDVALTRRLMEAGDIMGITVLDHVILADRGFHSLRESGNLAGAAAAPPR